MKLLLPISIICIITMTIYTAGYIYILIYEETLKVYLKIVAGIVIFSYNCLTVFYLYDHLIKFYLLFSNKSKKDQDELVNDSYGHQLKRSTTNATPIGYQESRSISESRRQLRASMTEKKLFLFSTNSHNLAISVSTAILFLIVSGKHFLPFFEPGTFAIPSLFIRSSTINLVIKLLVGFVTQSIKCFTIFIRTGKRSTGHSWGTL